MNLCVFGALPDCERVKVTRREDRLTCQSKKSLRRLTPLVLIKISKGGLLTSAVNRWSSMSFSVIDLASNLSDSCSNVTLHAHDLLDSSFDQGIVHGFLHSRRDLVPRRVRHAHIEHGSATVIMLPTRPRARPLPIIILGQLFCLGQGRLNCRRKELSSPHGI